MDANAILTRSVNVLVAVAVAVMAAPANAQMPAAVRTEPVLTEKVQEHRRVTGSLQAVARSAVASQEAGQVLEVLTDEGLAVEEGEVIARLDSRRMEAQLAEAKARKDRAESDLAERLSQLQFAEFENQRLSRLHRDQVASNRESIEAATQYAGALARVDAARRAIVEAQRQVDLLSIRLEDMTIRAPYAARVVARHVDSGEWIELGAPIVTLVSRGAIEARLEVPERLADALARNSDRIYADVAGLGRTAPSTEIRIVPDVDPNARSFRVVLTLENPDGIFAPGMSVVAWVPTSDEGEHLTVPKSAVVRNGRDAYVYRSIVNDAGVTTAERLPVAALFDWQDRVVVTSPILQAGDRVVVEGNERIAPGAVLAQADAQ